jgi:ankyrin repeat protein
VNQPVDLIKAIRTGLLSEVIAALNAGAQLELHDGQGDPGLPLAMACFMGHAEIVRELAIRGAKVNFADNMEPTSPLSMALRGGKTEVIKVLIEFGAEIPAGVKTGLTDQELMLARWKAQHFGAGQSSGDGQNEPVIEEIQMVGCYGTDTSVLEADVMRYARELGNKK